TIKRGAGRFKGIAVTPRDVESDTLASLKDQGIVGIALNVAMLGTEPFLQLDALMGRLAELDLFAQIQVQNDQLLALMPLLSRTRTRLLIDHSGRPDVSAGVAQPAFQALLSLAGQQRTSVKLSGLAKFSRQPYPFSDGHPYLLALLDAFGAENCMWGSDWPFLRASERMDMGTQLLLIEQLIPDEKSRRQVLWHTPQRLFGFTELQESR
ncbi:amidohydrolase family protein, partial [Pantoea endophytica]|uniref:amidohydrolase family protein n=1 Tax=Pantoea endophytica TaxID=92488 RepID=UPI002896D709